MSETIEAPTISEADEQALLDSIDRWLTRKVAPIANKQARKTRTCLQ